MIRFLGALIATMIALSATLLALTAPEPAEEKVTALRQANVRNLEVSTSGCVRLWKPAPDDPTKMPPDRQPGLAGVYLLTPLASTPATEADLPTYVLTPSATLNFSQHVGHKVAITGTAQAAPTPPTVQEIVNAPTQRPENKPSISGLPRLTVTTLKMVGEACP